MAVFRTGLAEILNYSEQVPNWAPNERFLPNADYGRIGALKLAKNLFDVNIDEYVKAGVALPWGAAGQYHYYLLGKNFNRRRNESIRVGLPTAPAKANFKWGNFDYELQGSGPHYVSEVMSQVSEAARIYGFSPQVLMSAIMTLASDKIYDVTLNEPARASDLFKDGYNMALMNFGTIESLWGIRGSGYPQTYRKTPGGGFAAREGYGGGKGKRGRKGKKRRRY